MDPTTAPGGAFEALLQHLPSGWQWTPTVAAMVMTGIGIVFLVKGAKLAPVLAAIGFSVLGGLGGLVLATVFALPALPLTIVVGTIGLILGIVLFRVWFAMLVAVSLIFLAVGVYGDRVVVPLLNDYQVQGLTEDGGAGTVTLPEPADDGRMAELARLRSYIQSRRPNFELSVGAIILAAGAAGLVVALLLPRASRAFWAATMGVLLAGPGLFTLTRTYWPQGAGWLEHWGLTLAALIWAASVIYNLSDVTPRRLKKAPAPEPKQEMARP